MVRGRGRLFPIGVTERGQEIVLNWRAVHGLRIPRSSHGFLFLSLPLLLSLAPSGKFSHMPRWSGHCCANPTKTEVSPSPLVPCSSLLSNLANPLEIATCGREAAQLIYVVSKAFTGKREFAVHPRCISRITFAREFVIAIISSNLSLPLTGCFFFFFDLPYICIRNRCGLFHDGTLQSEIIDSYVWIYIVFTKG